MRLTTSLRLASVGVAAAFLAAIGAGVGSGAAAASVAASARLMLQAPHATLTWLGSAPQPEDRLNPDSKYGTCKYPMNGFMCVRQGKSVQSGWTVTCSVPSTCGTMTWSVAFSNAGLTGTFRPLRTMSGQQTIETVRASRTIPVGNYKQTISVTCSTTGKVCAFGTYPIHVLK
jgi:hypothetical protein